MLLKKIEMYGFKSFADRITIDFDKGITAIVGPNGSGKSNVGDAIRWVLGEQSAKSLRGRKMEDIIFSGTQVRKPLGFAEVSLTLDNVGQKLPIEYSEVNVTRRVFRSGESEYYINKTPCRLKDINELFMDTGVGKEGYSIIGQGRIEDILSSQSEIRRQVFEEAAGIVKYKTRKEEAERKLAATRDNIIRIEDIIGEIEHRLDPLKKQSEGAKKYLKLRDKLKIYDLNKFILEYDSYKKRIEDMGENLSLLDGDIENHKKNLQNKELEANTQEKELEKINKDYQALQDSKYSLLNEKEKLKGRIGVLQERLAQLHRDDSRLETEIQNGEGAILDKEKEKKAIEENIKYGENLLEKTLKNFSSLEERLEKIQEKLSKSYMDIKARKDRLDETLNALSEARNSITKYRTQKKGIEEQLKDLYIRIEGLEGTKDSLNTKYKSLKDNANSLRIDLDEKLKEKESLDKKLKALKDSVLEWDNKLQRQKQQLEGDKSRLKILVDMESAYEGYQKSVKGILIACDKNPALKNKVLGVVAELIKVPKKYERAIETALGASLQHIVTQGEEDAKYIIEFLKSRRLGRATFLPIATIRGRNLNNRELGALSMEGALGRGPDLIKFDERYRAIFENLLGRVLIAENLSQAIIIARRFSNSFRIVTLDGDVINSGGSMTGGSINRRHAGIIGRKREIDDLKARIGGLIKDMEIGTKERDNILEKHHHLKGIQKDILDKIHSLEIQIATGTEHLEGIESQLIKAGEEDKNLKAMVKRLKGDILLIDRKIKAKDELVKSLEAKDKDLRSMAESMDISIEDINKEKVKLDDERVKSEIEIARLRQEISSFGERKDTIQIDIGIQRKAILENRKELEENARTKLGLEEDSKEYIQRIEEIDALSKDREEKLLEKRSIKEKLSLEIEKIEKSIKEAASTLEHIRDRKHSLEIQLSRAEIELENIQNNIWEEYELSYANALKYRDEDLNLTKIKRDIKELKEKIGKLKNINLGAIEEYKKEKERYDFLKTQKDDLLKAKENLEEVIKDITDTMEGIFTEEFAIINEHFNKVFQNLFGGGKAELILEEPEDVLGSGIEIVAQPPGKKLQSISLLSGGEKALTAISILFAILEHKPTPFCVLDEIESALDDSNVQNFGGYLKKFSEKTQFLLITHRRGTMENSDVLYGVAMEEKGVSKLISVRLDEDMAS